MEFTLIADRKKTNRIGFVGENLARTVYFTVVDEWRRKLGEGGTFVLNYRKPTATTPTAQTVTVEEGAVIWRITSANVETAGCGVAQLSYVIGGRVAKTERYTVEILEGL